MLYSYKTSSSPCRVSSCAVAARRLGAVAAVWLGALSVAGPASAQVDLNPEPNVPGGRGGVPPQSSPQSPSQTPSEPTPGAPPSLAPPSLPDMRGVGRADGGAGSSSSSKGEPGMMGLPFPKSRAEIAKTLDSLYAFLATEGDKRKGGEIGGAIERMWRLEGSDTVVLLIDRAGSFLQINKPEQALPFADAAVDLAPDYADGWAHRAYLYYRLENYKAALGDLRRALALEPNHFRALDAMAKILVQIGEKQAAYKAYEKLLSIHPNIEGGQTAYDELKREVEGRGI